MSAIVVITITATIIIMNAYTYAGSPDNPYSQIAVKRLSRFFLKYVSHVTSNSMSQFSDALIPNQAPRRARKLSACPVSRGPRHSSLAQQVLCGLH